MASRVLAGVAAIAVLLAGVWLFASPLSRAFADASGVPAYWSSIGFAVAWFVLAAVVLGRLRRERPPLRLPLRVAFVVTVAAVGGAFAWTSLTDDVASDDVSFADRESTVVLSAGSFTGIDHTATGRARIVELPSGDRRLVLTEFDVERAPDLRLYLSEDRVTGDIGPYIELDRLKGNVGDQYYELPESADLDRYGHVVIWCKAFDVGVAQAPLGAA